MTQVPIEKSALWKEAKEKLSRVSFPRIINPPAELMSGESHSMGKHEHMLKTFKMMVSPINGFEVFAKWNHCETCGETRNKFLYMTDLIGGSVFVKHFIKKGMIQYG